MQISSRFAEYGLTGGFFWMCHLLVGYAMGVRFASVNGVIAAASTWAGTAPEAVTTTVTTLLAGFAIVGVFVTGVILDLASSVLFVVENRILRWHLARDREWLLPFLQQYGPFCAHDLAEFQRLPQPPSFLGAVFPFAFFVDEKYRRQLQQYRGPSLIKVAQHASRIWSLLTSYVLVRSASAQHTLFSDQIYLWRSARALAATLVFIYLEVSFAPIVSVTKGASIGSLAYSGLLIVGAIALAGLGLIVTGATYSRACGALLAAVFVTSASPFPTESVIPSPSLSAGGRRDSPVNAS